MVLFQFRFSMVDAVRNRNLISIVLNDLFDRVNFSLFAFGVEVICVGSVQEISNGSQLVLLWMARVTRNNDVRGGRFPMYVEGDFPICLDQGDIKKIQFAVYFLF